MGGLSASRLILLVQAPHCNSRKRKLQMESWSLPKIPVMFSAENLVYSTCKTRMRTSLPPHPLAARPSSTRFGFLRCRRSPLRSPAPPLFRPSASSGSSTDVHGEASGNGSPAGDIVLQVEGMMCDGCAASVKRILESQPQVSTASVSFGTGTALIWALAEVKITQNWKQQIGEKLAQHLTTCGFTSCIKG